MLLYDFTVKTQDGREVSLGDYKGKTVLVVNTATGCGFTPQYSELQDAYDELKDQGLEILDFPCNQFYNQAPGSDEEIHDFCNSRYGITFPQFSKINVNGPDAIPLYKWITESTGFAGFEGQMQSILEPIVAQQDPDYKNNGSIKWNFTKILINKEGQIVQRFEPTADVKKVVQAIKEVL